jgi:hypothetical protein
VSIGRIWKLFEGDVAPVSTFAFHEHRDRAAHLEDPAHRPRLLKAYQLVLESNATTVSDLGCGDGGLLSLIKGYEPSIRAWGYDFAPANAIGWKQRAIEAYPMDVFGANQNDIAFGECTVVTEVLEHLSDPMGAVEWIGRNSSYIVASSPWCETDKYHDECHAWAFDPGGYAALIKSGGYDILRHEIVGGFQVVLGVRG